ncbi:aldehyde dehydrogenase family protein [Halomicroarcula limicola]|uniref:Aldehyde dehydrogenase family protein n=1 Tax=Haloarcula limicola TaxID=1429915 RepID=A0A8J8C9D7_9EURY|nr:aldehyde dehydrogenase family protein [Halomicroarcula limicola]MBV0925390.1 aldehyde dehydrogenase family protein [Halomicroarcula limicola]
MAYQNFIGGEWCDSASGETTPSRNPAAPDEVVGEVPRSTAADATAAVDAAAAASGEWAATPGPERGAVLREAGGLLEDRRDDITETLVREEGKTWSEAAGELQRALDIFHYYASKAADVGGEVRASSARERHLYVDREPVGIVSAITPWNYPIAIPAWKLAPALATGNAAVLKPATAGAVTAIELVRCLDDAGFPDGVCNLVTGPGDAVGGVLTTDDRVDAVSFTGSETVGDIVYQAAAPDQKRVQLEMGGKNPTVVMPSADVGEAVDIVGGGAFGTTGQSCTACSRAIVHEDVHGEFLDRIVEYAESLSVGPGIDDPDMGPHVSEAELTGTLDYVDIARNEGATLETGGNRLGDDELADGYFVEPTVFSDVEPDMRIAQEEVFGPILSVVSVESFEDALDVANGVTQGLSASVVTDDLREAHRFVREVEAGVVKTNEKTTGLELHVPFGGMKASSSETYREQGDAGLDFYTISKTVYLNY